MRKILIALLGVLLVAALAGAGTFAYFSDTETSTGNTFAAGTIDLTLNQSAPAPINLTNMKPGDDVSATITVQNVGSLAGKLYADASYTEQDNTNTTEFTTNMTADQTAKMLLITAFTADSIDILSQIPDVDTDSRKTVYDLVNDPSGIDLTPNYAGGPWYSYDTNMTSGESHTYAMTIKFDENAGNDYQNDGIVLNIYYLLTQQ